MENLLKFLKRKSQLEYDLNCVEKYMNGGEFDEALEKAWERYKKELVEVEKEIGLLSNPSTKEFEEKKLELLEEIIRHEESIHKLKSQLKSIEDKLLSIV